MGAAPVTRASSVAGRARQQHGDAVQRLAEAGLEHRYLGAGLFQVRARLLGVERAVEPCARAPCRELRGVGQGLEVAPRDAQPFLQRAHVDVFQRHLGGERDLHVAQARLAGFHVGLRGLVGAPHAAEQVGLPHRIEAGLVETAGAAAAVGTAAAAARVRGRGVHARIPVRGGLVARSARASRSLARAWRTSVFAASACSISAASVVSPNWAHHRAREAASLACAERPSPSGVCQLAGAAVSGAT
jgi:hypothetical protein